MEFLERLDRKDPVLIVSLPRNDLALARAAIAGGAHAIKVHLNVEHRASGTRFGSLVEERPALDGILACARAAGVAAGVMPGTAEAMASEEDLGELAGLGVVFLDAYAHHLPARYLGAAGLRTMIAFGPDWTPERVRSSGATGAHLVEASIVEPGHYGQPLTAADLLAYRVLADATDLPVIVPTQKRILVGDVEGLRRAGVTGIMLGAVVTGADPGSVTRITSEFRDALACAQVAHLC